MQGHARSAGVRLGEWDTSTDPDCQDSVCAPPVHDIDPETVIIHQDYNSPRFANDIALVKLAQRINFNGVPLILEMDLRRHRMVFVIFKSFSLMWSQAGWGLRAFPTVTS